MLDSGRSLVRYTYLKISARIPHPPQCAHWGTFPPGEGIRRGRWPAAAFNFPPSADRFSQVFPAQPGKGAGNWGQAPCRRRDRRRGSSPAPPDLRPRPADASGGRQASQDCPPTRTESGGTMQRRHPPDRQAQTGLPALFLGLPGQWPGRERHGSRCLGLHKTVRYTPAAAGHP